MPRRSSPPTRRTLALAAALVASAAAIAQAQPSAADRPLAVGRDDAARLGAERGPTIGIAAAPRSGVSAAGQASRALLVHPPRLTISAGRRAGDFGAGAELGGTLVEEIPLARVGRARSETASALSAVTETDVARARLESATDAALAWVDAVEARNLEELRTRSLEHAKTLAATIRTRAKAGTAMPDEVALAEGELGAAEAAVLDAEGMLIEALARLRFAIGAGATQAIEPTGDLYAVDERDLDEASVVRAALERSPAIRLAEARARLARQEERLAASTLAPTLGVGASYLHEGTGDRIWTGIVAIPLPFASPAAFERARQQAAADTAQAGVSVERSRLELAVRIALHDRHHYREVRDALATRSVEPLREALRVAEARFAAGTADVTSVLVVWQRLLGSEEQLARAAAEVQRADIRVAAAAGTLVRP